MQPETTPYYLRHFLTALDWLTGSRMHLLAPSDLEFAQQFRALPPAAQGLWVRLTLRSRAHFKRSQLNYPELDPLDPALEALVALGWISVTCDLTANEYFHLASKADLDGHERKARKADHWPALANLAPRNAQAWGLSEPVITHTSRTQADRLRLAFFGQLHQDWSEFVLAELGIRDYPDYPISAQGGFQDRAEFEACWALEQHLIRFEHDLSSTASRAALQRIQATGPTFRRRRERVLHHIARDLERLGEHEAALALHQSNHHPDSRIRCMRLLEDSQPLEAWRLVQQMHLFPDSEAEHQAIQPARRRLNKQFGVSQIRNKRFQPIEKTLEIPLGHQRVETACAQALAADQYQVIYSENALFNLLFRLHYWDALYAPVTGAFFNPFQYMPADLGQPDFARRRQDQWPSQVCARTLLRNYERAPEGIRQSISPGLLQNVLDCIPTQDLQAIFDRIWINYKVNRSGFPDLIRLDLEHHNYELIEVKGPGDRLQAHQRRWMAYFHECGIPAWVCHVKDATRAAV